MCFHNNLPPPNPVLLHSCSCSLLLYLLLCWPLPMPRPGQVTAASQRARWGHECRCWRHSKGHELTAVRPRRWLSASCADSALAHQTLQLAAVYFKYHTNRESKGRIFYPSTNSFTAHRTNVMPSSLTSAITTAGQTRFLHQPTECLWDSQPNSSPCDCYCEHPAVEQDNPEQEMEKLK